MFIEAYNVDEENIVIEPEVETILSEIEQKQACNNKNEFVEQNEGLTNYLISLRSQIDESLDELGELISKEISLHTAGELEALESEIIKKSDKLAGLILGFKIQENLDSHALRDEAKKLTKMFSGKMKNQGIRDVKLQPLRGESVVIKTSYYSPNSKKDKRKKTGMDAILALFY